ncbi:fimbria/pilus outer membrane usher protein [Taklimakanibacter lacteus]|uniref:fimbria/pilus outer membrane usher protein n=1 Tax=Taklimakanibacter lacteus TaxID=2268456 RepID=UPI000E670F62
MERAWSSRLHKALAVGLAVLGLSTTAAQSNELAKADRLAPADVQESSWTKAAEMQPLAASPVVEGPVLLQLETFINGVSTGLIGSFRRAPDGALSATADELSELGLVPVDAARAADGMIELGRLPGVSHEYDEAAQAIRFTAGDRQRIPRRLGAESRDETRPAAERGFGALVNYALTANFDTTDYTHLPDYSGAFGYFDGRVFTPWGTLDSSFSARSTREPGEYVTRLDTAWVYSDPGSLRTYVAGDFISSGLAWTRPIRMGGLQVRRNFALRPDLVTLPIPELSGSAAVPSALEIYVNGVRSYANDIPGGPFVVDNLPAVTGPGLARVVVRDTATGQETETEVAFYASARLLRPGLADYAVEAGFARTDYGISSDSYDGDAIASASWRYGLSDRLTLEAHGEGGAGLLNGGAGIVLGLGGWGVGSIAGAWSGVDGEQGFLIAGSLETAFGDWRLFLRSQRSFEDYNDLASVTADGFKEDLHFFSATPPRALDQISLSIPLFVDASSLNLSFTHIKNAADESEIVGLSYDRPFFADSTLFATAYADLGDSDEVGVYAGISMQLGGNISAGAGLEYAGGHTNAFVDAVKPDQDIEGSVGWRIHAGLGEEVNSRAAASYVGRHARLEAGARQYGRSVNLAAQLRGSVIAAGGDVFFAREIDDSFAVVDVGAPDVEVSAANRPVGRSGRSGKVIVPRLSAYERNRIAIDPANLPVDADIPETSRIVVPADKTGIVVSFRAKADGRAALVRFIDAGGRPLDAGLAGRSAEGGEEFIVGYDGEAYLTGLSPSNAVTIDLMDGSTCHARFDFYKAAGEQKLISGVLCQ